MIGYFGDIIFETNDKKICNFNNLKRSASASFAEHKRYNNKSQREFTKPENQTASFEMKIKAGHGVSPAKMMEKLISYCETGEVCAFFIGGRKVGNGRWTIDDVSVAYNEVWNRGELVSVTLSVSATEYS